MLNTHPGVDGGVRPHEILQSSCLPSIMPASRGGKKEKAGLGKKEKTQNESNV